MRHEVLYRQYQTLEKRAQGAEAAILRLQDTANRLQRGDYSGFTHLRPGIDKNGQERSYSEVNQRGMRVVNRIKSHSLPLVAGFSDKAEEFKTENKDNFPLRISLKELRVNAGMTITSLANKAQLTTSIITSLESGKKPPFAPHIQKYIDFFNLSSDEAQRMMDRVDRERVWRQEHFVSQRVKGAEPDSSQSFARQLKHLREKRGYSYKRLGDILGLSPEVIFQIENRPERQTYESTLIHFWNSQKFPVPDSMRPSWLTNPSNKGEYLRMLRVKAGLTKRAFADLACRNETAIKRTETVAEPTSATIGLYERVLGVKVTFPKFD